MIFNWPQLLACLFVCLLACLCIGLQNLQFLVTKEAKCFFLATEIMVRVM